MYKRLPIALDILANSQLVSKVLSYYSFAAMVTVAIVILGPI